MQTARTQILSLMEWHFHLIRSFLPDSFSWSATLSHFCGLCFVPSSSDFNSLNEADCAKNNQLAFDVAEREFGIQPVTTGKEMDSERGPDKLIMVLYLSKYYEMFRNSTQSNTGKAFLTLASQ